VIPRSLELEAWRELAESQLREDGLRLAGSDEDGWYTIVHDEHGRAVKVWVTDLPPRHNSG
jgi:hypothetical protein